MGVAGDAQAARRAPASLELGQLAHQHLGVDHDAGAEDAHGLGGQDPRRQQMELELLVAHEHRVPGVAAALVAGDERVPLGEDVDDLALALVAPLGANDDGCRHVPQRSERGGGQSVQSPVVSHLIADITGIHHFSIGCSDADRSIAFYRDLFGMELISDREVEPADSSSEVTGVAGARRAHRAPARATASTSSCSSTSTPRGDRRAREPNHAGSAHLCFIAADLDAGLRRLSEHGVAFRPAAWPGHGRRWAERRRQGRLRRGPRRERRRDRAARAAVAQRGRDSIVDTGLADKTAIVTGAASGIGLACSRALAAEGARVVSPTSTAAPRRRGAATLGERSLGVAGRRHAAPDACRLARRDRACPDAGAWTSSSPAPGSSTRRRSTRSRQRNGIASRP